MRIVLLTVVFLALVFSSHGYSRLRHEIPNGFNVKHPCPGQPIWNAVGHISPDYAPRKNAFGESMKANNLQWEHVCPMDSDGDGLSNGAELGDPACKWKPGEPYPGEVLGHPGFCEPDREKCDSGMTHPQCPNPKASGASRQRPRARQAPPGSQDHPQTDWRKQIMGERVPHGPTRSIFSGSNMPVRGQEIFGRDPLSSLPQRPDAGFSWGSGQPALRSVPRLQTQPEMRFPGQLQGGQILPSRQLFGEFDGGTIGRIGDSSNFPQTSDFAASGGHLGQQFIPVGSSRMESQGPSPGRTMVRPVQDRLPREHMDFSGSMVPDIGMISSGIGGSNQEGMFPEFMSGTPDSGMRRFPMF